MTASKILSAALLTLFVGSAVSQSKVYRCPQSGGTITMSDRPCRDGDVREGNGWVSLREIERKNAEAAERAKREDDEKRRREAAADHVREQEKQLQHRKLAPTETAQSNASSPSNASIDRMTSYSTVLGRAIGCGFDVDAPLKQVGAWFDKEFPLGPSKEMYLRIMAAGIQQNAINQKNGRSPDSCSALRRQLQDFPWPQ